MPHSQSRYRKVAVLTPQGFQKLQCAMVQLSAWNPITQTCSLEALSEQTGLSPQTLSKVHARQTNVDLRTLVRYFNALNLDLKPDDYIAPPRVDKNLEKVPASSPSSTPASLFPVSNSIVSWGTAPDVSVFYGRSTELNTLRDWVLQQRCRVVTLVGMGGIGKTWLATRLAEQLQDKFQIVIWRSLKPLSRSFPSPLSFNDFITDLIQHLVPASKHPVLETAHAKVRCLLDCLNQTRCLLILDNVESVLQGFHPFPHSGNNDAIAHPPPWEEYETLLRALSQGRHRSCVVLSSREEPKRIQQLSGNNLAVRVFPLQGLQLAEAQQILEVRNNLQGSPTEWNHLIAYYGGNPLFLETAATTIQHLFGGNISAFLNQNALIFGEIQESLDQQFDGLSHIEQDIIKILAKQETLIRFAEMRSHIPLRISTSRLLAAVNFLKARSLLEISTSSEYFSLPPLLKNYIKERYSDEQAVTLRALPLIESNFYA